MGDERILEELNAPDQVRFDSSNTEVVLNSHHPFRRPCDVHLSEQDTGHSGKTTLARFPTVLSNRPKSAGSPAVADRMLLCHSRLAETTSQVDHQNGRSARQRPSSTTCGSHPALLDVHSRSVLHIGGLYTL